MGQMSSQSFPLFERFCDEILDRLKDDISPLAQSYKSQAQTLRQVVVGWKIVRPAPQDRHETTRKIVELYRSAMEHATRSATTMRPKG